MKNSLKKHFYLREKLFSLLGIFDKWKNGFSLARKTVKFFRSSEVFFKNWLPHNFKNGFH